VILWNNVVSTLIAGSDINAHVVTTLPDGRICYSKLNGKLILIDPDKGITDILGSVPSGIWISALAADQSGNVYAATSDRKVYRFDPSGNRFTVVTNLPFDDIGYSIWMYLLVEQFMSQDSIVWLPLTKTQI